MKSNNNNNNDDYYDDDDDDYNNNNTAKGSVHARGDTFLTFGLKALTETNTSRLATGSYSYVNVCQGDYSTEHGKATKQLALLSVLRCGLR
jgi:hypothetical protein